MSMQPSEDEILREVEALRDIKRRSTAQGGPGTLTIDPDLPELHASSSGGHSSPTWPGSTGSTPDSFPKPSVIDDPSHLFWVPARLHPEIAPQEFREFLKEHSRDVISGSESDDPNSLSPDTTKVSRRRSMLSRQYKPSELDGVENEQVIIRRNTLSSRAAPQLTISDLQKLDEITQAVSEGDDPSKISTMLRRSLSLNTSISESADGKTLDMDDTDSPIIVPPPNQILRRAARTKIRKPSLQGDGGGHRFPSSRRAARSNTISTTDGSEHDYNDLPMTRIAQEPEAEADIRHSPYTDETSIFDSYSDKRESLTSSESPDRSEDDHRVTTSPPPLQIPPIPTAPQLQFDLESFDVSLTPTPELTIHEPIPQRQLTIPDGSPSRSPSPTHSDSGSTEFVPSPQPSASSSQREIQQIPDDSPTPQPSRPVLTTTPSSLSSRKDKEKKGLFGKWGGDKKKSKPEITRVENKDFREKEKEKEKEKDSGFFVSLFGGKKKPEESTTGLLHGSTGPATAAALLGASKPNKTNIRTPSPQPAGSYARYPIHVERAIYRLSHIKLANARRPLLEQVLISNLMFWYLGIINRPATTSPPSQNQTFEQITQQQTQGPFHEKEAPSLERDNMEHERPERERQDREAKERSDTVRRENGRKGNFNRGGKPGTEGGVRRAEVSVRGPQYESQYRAMEQEYTTSPSYNYNSGGYSSQGTTASPIVRTGSAPPAPMSSSPVYQQYANQRLGLTPQQMAQGRTSNQSLQQSNSQSSNDSTHLHHPQPVHQVANPSYVLPPGAMSPHIAFDKSWQNTSSGPTSPNSSNQGSYVYNPSPSPPPVSNQSQQRSSQSPPPRQPRSPPPQNYPSHPRSRSVTPPSGRGSRSVSVESFPGSTASGKLKKKASPIQTSNTDSVLHKRMSDADSPGDDVPLAVWQQQHRASSNHQSGASI